MSKAVISAVIQAPLTSDVATTNLKVMPQAAFATATVNKVSASLEIDLSPSVGGAAEPAFILKRGSFVSVAIGALTAAPTTFGQMLMAGVEVLRQGGNTLTIGFGVPNTIIAANTANFAQLLGTGAHRGWQLGYPAVMDLGGGDMVIGVSAAITAPTTNPSGGDIVVWADPTVGHFKARGMSGAITTMAPAGSVGTVNSQKQISDVQIGTCETVSSATPTQIWTYATVSGTGGLLTIKCVSRATTTGAGIAVGDSATATYEVAYKNVGGTVTLDTTGITLQGTARTTAAALTSPVLTASVATNMVTILVTNVALCTVDSQTNASIAAA